ncbi:hypothetical protein GCM10027275_28600 [Rhabdobacter roseus]|uniref:Cell division protein FtsQ n=2 Tax=Rhabdobacter roseus TaxID=1655419 RepID=A0A840TYU6_9BACT|nr:cell division protein FtsQ [Rhabdobacter roseus]
MAERKLSKLRCKDLVVKVDYESGMRFVNQTDVEKLLTNNGSDPLQGNKHSELPLGVLEQRVKKNKLVKNCQVFRDLDGNLVIEVEQEKPLARWVTSSRNGEWRKTDGFYINEEGSFLPLSDRFSARTLLVSGPFFQNLNDLNGKKGKSVLDLIRFVTTDAFWQAQVIQLIVDKEGEVELLTALGNQRVEFGLAENIEPKLTKLRIFYEEVMHTDWSRYSKISVKFRDQIVCE